MKTSRLQKALYNVKLLRGIQTQRVCNLVLVQQVVELADGVEVALPGCGVGCGEAALASHALPQESVQLLSTSHSSSAKILFTHSQRPQRKAQAGKFSEEMGLNRVADQTIEQKRKEKAMRAINDQSLPSFNVCLPLYPGEYRCEWW